MENLPILSTNIFSHDSIITRNSLRGRFRDEASFTGFLFYAYDKEVNNFLDLPADIGYFQGSEWISVLNKSLDWKSYHEFENLLVTGGFVKAFLKSYEYLLNPVCIVTSLHDKFTEFYLNYNSNLELRSIDEDGNSTNSRLDVPTPTYDSELESLISEANNLLSLTSDLIEDIKVISNEGDVADYVSYELNASDQQVSIINYVDDPDGLNKITAVTYDKDSMHYRVTSDDLINTKENSKDLLKLEFVYLLDSNSEDINYNSNPMTMDQEEHSILWTPRVSNLENIIFSGDEDMLIRFNCNPISFGNLKLVHEVLLIDPRLELYTNLGYIIVESDSDGIRLISNDPLVTEFYITSCIRIRKDENSI
jgi:hypothetical protein